MKKAIVKSTGGDHDNKECSLCALKMKIKRREENRRNCEGKKEINRHKIFLPIKYNKDLMILYSSIKF